MVCQPRFPSRILLTGGVCGKVEIEPRDSPTFATLPRADTDHKRGGAAAVRKLRGGRGLCKVRLNMQYHRTHNIRRIFSARPGSPANESLPRTPTKPEQGPIVASSTPNKVNQQNTFDRSPSSCRPPLTPKPSPWPTLI
jgi:hypothetical protein